jgi:hypothetical protein
LESDQWIEEMRQDNERQARTAQEIEMRKHNILFTLPFSVGIELNFLSVAVQ